MLESQTYSKPESKAKIWIVLLFFFIAELLFYAWCRVQYTHIGYEIAKESKHLQELLVIQKDYKIKLAELTATRRIAGIAEKKLKLSLPVQDQIIEIK